MYMPDIAGLDVSGHKPGESVICTGKIEHFGKYLCRTMETFEEPCAQGASTRVQDRFGGTGMVPHAVQGRREGRKEGRAYTKDIYASDKEYFADIAKAY